MITNLYGSQTGFGRSLLQQEQTVQQNGKHVCIKFLYLARKRLWVWFGAAVWGEGQGSRSGRVQPREGLYISLFFASILASSKDFVFDRLACVPALIG